MRLLRFTTIVLALLCVPFASAQREKSASAMDGNNKPKKQVQLEPSWAWRITEPLGERYESTIDTLQYNYQRQAVPSMTHNAFATTGNLGAAGMNMNFFERETMSEFFFADALSAWLPSTSTQRFYNTRIPMTLLSYNTGGGKENTQDRLRAIFSGNINGRAQVGAMLDYIYSKGAYELQSDKDFTWGLNGSYMGDRYEMQAFFNHYSFTIKENGGITDDRYITKPEDILSGETSIDARSIPVRLSAAHSVFGGQQFFMNHRYKVGYYHTERDSLVDSIVHRTYIPVTSFIWTMNYRDAKHRFLNSNAKQDTSYFNNTYLQLGGTDDNTKYWSLTNTVGVQLLEGFHKYAKFGLAAYVTHEIRRYTQNPDSLLYLPDRSPLLDPLPEGVKTENRFSENLVWVGGQLTKKRGSLLTYTILAKFGVVGSVAGDIDIGGEIGTRFPLFGDSVSVTGYGFFRNEEAPYLMKRYVSNHFIWDNDFSKQRTFRAGGRLVIPHTGTSIDAGFQTLENYLYFDKNGMPQQTGSNVNVFIASLSQRLAYRILHWDNELTYQTTSNDYALPLPALTVYSNLYLQFKIARVLNVQFGVDCSYYTKYKAPSYNPATMTFNAQDEVEVGNYPFMNAYVNCKLKKTRFYLLMSHVNQGLFKANYFALPHYPLNPRRFQIGLCVDFAN